jgi:carboxypeptidase Taq
LSSCVDLLQWDEEVCMPRGGGEHRADQMALVAGLVHDRGTDPRYDELLSTVEASSLMSDAESAEAVNVRELRRDYERERRIPRRLVEESARVTALASQAWAEARRRDDFKSFAPWLDQVFALAREEADAVGYAGTRYDALLDDYEPGLTTDRLSTLFARLEADLVPLASCAARNTRTGADASYSRASFPLDRQRLFAEGVAGRSGIRSRARTPRSGKPSVLHVHRTGRYPDCAPVLPANFRARFFRPLARNRACAL